MTKSKKTSKIRLLNGTKNNNTSSHMLLDHFCAFGLSLWPSGKEEVCQRQVPSVTYFGPDLDPPLGGIWPKNNNTCKEP